MWFDLSGMAKKKKTPDTSDVSMAQLAKNELSVAATIYGKLLDYYMHQNTLLWGRAQMLVLLESGLIAYAIGNLGRLRSIAANAGGLIAAIALFFLIRRDTRIRDQFKDKIEAIGSVLSNSVGALPKLRIEPSIRNFDWFSGVHVMVTMMTITIWVHVFSAMLSMFIREGVCYSATGCFALIDASWLVGGAALIAGFEAHLLMGHRLGFTSVVGLLGYVVPVVASELLWGLHAAIGVGIGVLMLHIMAYLKRLSPTRH